MELNIIEPEERINFASSLNVDYSQDFKQVLLGNASPVVMSGGIFSNLNTFAEGLGPELVNDGHDVW